MTYINLKGYKYDPEFCTLIGANPNIPYTKSKIFNILTAQSISSHRYFKFEPNLHKFISKFGSGGYYGFNKTTIYTILNSLMIVSNNDNTINSKYVIISSNKSDVVIKEISIIL